jgi:hypothetical protein
MTMTGFTPPSPDTGARQHARKPPGPQKSNRRETNRAQNRPQPGPACQYPWRRAGRDRVEVRRMLLGRQYPGQHLQIGLWPRSTRPRLCAPSRLGNG